VVVVVVVVGDDCEQKATAAGDTDDKYTPCVVVVEPCVPSSQF